MGGQAHHEGAYEVFRAFRPVEGLQPVELDQKIIHELGRLEQICSGIMREDDILHPQLADLGGIDERQAVHIQLVS